MTASRPIVTIVGGGAFTPRLCEALAAAIDLPELCLRLSARRTGRLHVLAAHTARRLAVLRPGWSVEAMATLEAALEGAAIVVLLVRVGGLEARAWDEAFPKRFGLVGDEGLGPGGIANGWRTMPVLGRLADAIRRTAPAARVVNLMAPLGLTTRLLLDQQLDAFGLCELPTTTLEAWLARAGCRKGETTWRYAGLNHLGWFWDVRSDELDVLRLLTAELPFADDAAPTDRLTYERYGAMPLRYFYEIFDAEAARRLGLARAPGRASQLLALSETMFRRFASTPGLDTPEAKLRSTPWLDRAVAPTVAALLGGRAHEGVANIRNGDRIPELPPDLVVELAATFTAEGVRLVCPGPLPPPVAAFLRLVGHSEALAFGAAERQDPGLLAEAIRALPLPIPEAAVWKLAALASEREFP